MNFSYHGWCDTNNLHCNHKTQVCYIHNEKWEHQYIHRAACFVAGLSVEHWTLCLFGQHDYSEIINKLSRRLQEVHLTRRNNRSDFGDDLYLEPENYFYFSSTPQELAAIWEIQQYTANIANGYSAWQIKVEVYTLCMFSSWKAYRNIIYCLSATVLVKVKVLVIKCRRPELIPEYPDSRQSACRWQHA